MMSLIAMLFRRGLSGYRMLSPFMTEIQGQADRGDASRQVEQI
ncbi:MAG TPA: hypothetical protein VIM41_10805 [Gammaproteobacteria bacterium]